MSGSKGGFQLYSLALVALLSLIFGALITILSENHQLVPAEAGAVEL